MDAMYKGMNPTKNIPFSPKNGHKAHASLEVQTLRCLQTIISMCYTKVDIY